MEFFGELFIWKDSFGKVFFEFRVSSDEHVFNCQDISLTRLHYWL